MTRKIIDSYLGQVAQKVVAGSSTCYDGPAMATFTPLNGSPETDDYYLKVTVSGSDCTGTVTITGTRSDDSSGSEDLTYTSCRHRQSVYEYKHGVPLDSITSANLADEDPIPAVLIEFVDLSGNPITGADTYEDFGCRWEDNQVAYWNALGTWTLSKAKLVTCEPAEVNDDIRYDAEDFVIKKLRIHYDLDGTENYRTALMG